MNVDEEIDRLLHDAQHAVYGAEFAARIGHIKPAMELQRKYRKLFAEARELYLDNPAARWPHPEDCEWPAPKRPEPAPEAQPQDL